MIPQALHHAAARSPSRRSHRPQRPAAPATFDTCTPFRSNTKKAEPDNLSGSAFCCVFVCAYFFSPCRTAWAQMAAKVSSLMSCSILQASSSATLGSTPRVMRKRVRVWSVQHTGGNGHAGVRQGDEPLPVHGDVSVFPQTFGGVADTGLGDTQMLRHVDGTDIAALLLHHQHGLQIVLRGFLYLHGKLHQPFSDISYRLTQTNQKCKERKKFSKSP